MTSENKRVVRITMTRNDEAIIIELTIPPPSIDWIFNFVQLLRNGGYDVKLEEHLMVNMAEDLLRRTSQ